MCHSVSGWSVENKNTKPCSFSSSPLQTSFSRFSQDGFNYKIKTFLWWAPLEIILFAMQNTLLEPNKMILKYLTVAEREGMSKPVQLCQKFDKLVLTNFFCTFWQTQFLKNISLLQYSCAATWSSLSLNCGSHMCQN